MKGVEIIEANQSKR